MFYIIHMLIAPRTPLAKRMTCKFPNLKKNSCPPPPLPDPGDAPVTEDLVKVIWTITCLCHFTIRTIVYIFWCMLCYYMINIKAYRCNYKRILTSIVRNAIFYQTLHISVTLPLSYKHNLLDMELFPWEYPMIYTLQN